MRGDHRRQTCFNSSKVEMYECVEERGSPIHSFCLQSVIRVLPWLPVKQTELSDRDAIFNSRRAFYF